MLVDHHEAGAIEQRAGDTPVLAQQGEQQVLGLDRLLAALFSLLGRCLQGLLRLLGKTIKSHISKPYTQPVGKSQTQPA